MPISLTLNPSTFHSGVELVYSQMWTKIFRSQNFKLAVELVAILSLFAGAAIWSLTIPVI